MEKKLKKILLNHFPNSNNDPINWKFILDNSETSPSIFHLSHTIDYYTAYFSSENAINLSFVIYDNNQPIGIMPLIAHYDGIIWNLKSNGVEIVEPIFIKSLARRVRKKIEKKLINLIYELARQLNIRKCQFVNLDYVKLSNWYLLWSEQAAEVFSTHHILVDLSLSLNEIRLKFRKSFKPLINKGLRDWQIEVHEKVSDELFNKFRLLHKSVAGRSTRPIESWNKQKAQIAAEESFIVSASDKKNNLIGAGLFVHSRDRGFYNVGAYKRGLDEKSYGHAIQMKAIETFKKKGLKWYEIGQKHLKIDKKMPTKKQIAISHFMEGFATHTIALQHLIVNVKSA